MYIKYEGGAQGPRAQGPRGPGERGPGPGSRPLALPWAPGPLGPWAPGPLGPGSLGPSLIFNIHMYSVHIFVNVF